MWHQPLLECHLAPLHHFPQQLPLLSSNQVTQLVHDPTPLSLHPAHLLWHQPLLERHLAPLHHLPQQLPVRVLCKGHCQARGASTGRAADAVEVGLQSAGRIKVDDGLWVWAAARGGQLERCRWDAKAAVQMLMGDREDSVLRSGAEEGVAYAVDVGLKCAWGVTVDGLHKNRTYRV